jgi:hypothetical protein
MFANAVIDIGGVKDYMSKVDAKIRRIKEIYESNKSRLLRSRPSVMVQDLVAFIVSQIKYYVNNDN